MEDMRPSNYLMSALRDTAPTSYEEWLAAYGLTPDPIRMPAQRPMVSPMPVLA